MNEDIIHHKFTDFYIDLSIRYDAYGRRFPADQYNTYVEWFKENVNKESYEFIRNSTIVHLASKDDLIMFTLAFGRVYRILDEPPKVRSKIDEMLVNLKWQDEEDEYDDY